MTTLRRRHPHLGAAVWMDVDDAADCPAVDTYASR